MSDPFHAWFQDWTAALESLGILEAELIASGAAIPIRPCTLPRATVERWLVDLPRLVDIARRLAIRRWHATSNLVGRDEVWLERWLDRPRRPALLRPDGIVVQGQLKLVELNVDSAMGGIWEAEFLRDWLSRAPLDAALAAPRLGNPRAALLQLGMQLLAREGHRPRARVDIALLGFPGEPSFVERALQDAAGWVHAAGIRAHRVTPKELRVDDGWVTDGVHRFALVFRVNTLMQPDRDISEMVRVLAEASSAHRSIVLSDPIDLMVEHKGMLAELQTAELEGDEAELVARYLPWTVWARPGEVRYCGECVDLVDLLCTAQNALVLKRSKSRIASAIYLGAELSAAEWRQRVAAALGDSEPWVVQENLHGDLQTFHHYTPERGFFALERCCTISPFLFGEQFGGGIVRIELDPSRRVLSLPTNSVAGFTCLATD